jgi:aminoglycoside 3-N-acetyltransferase
LTKPRRVRTLAKRVLKTLKSRYTDAFCSFGPGDFARALRVLGTNYGDTLMVHCAYDAFAGFTGKPSDVITTLEEVIGGDGTLLMPSMPFTGTAVDYIRSGAVTDISRSPSRMGVVSEVFRRQTGTIRSVSATHPVLARGAEAERMVSGHEHASTPCGAHSPYAKLLEVNGKTLLLGTSIETMTFFHYLEEEFEHRLSASPLTSEFFAAPVRVNGEVLNIRTRLFEPRLSRRRRISIMLPQLERLNGISNHKVGRLRMSLIGTKAARDAFEAVLKQGLSFYDE